MRYLILLVVLFSLFACGEQTTAPDYSDTPANLRLLLITSSSIQLTWEDRSLRETGYLIQRRRDGDSQFSAIDTLSANSKSFLDEDLAPLTKYFYRVAAVLEDTLSSWSNVATLTTQSTVADMEFGLESSFEVMTWNIEKFPKMGDTTTNYVKQALLALQVDVVALQEIKEESTFQSLLSDLQLEDQNSDWKGRWEYTDGWGNNLALLYRNSQFENVQIYEIYEHDSYAFPRDPLVFEASFQGEHFIVINNHLKATWYETEIEDIDRRRQACRLLDEYIQENLANQKVIVVGDLNDEITDPENENVFWNFISNPDEYLFADWEIANAESSEWSYLSPPYISHLDHILVNAPVFPLMNQSITQTIKIDAYLTGGFTEYDTNISDHRPVALQIIFE